MSSILPADVSVNQLFGYIAQELQFLFGYSKEEAEMLAMDYYAKFRDQSYCRSIGVGVQDDDYFFHESAEGMALRIHYYLGLKEDPSPRKYLDWRQAYVAGRRR